MKQPDIANKNKRFVPPAARIDATGAAISVIIAIAMTAFSWLLFETSSPVVAIACGASAGGIFLVTLNWLRRRSSPPSLQLGSGGIVIEDRQERIIIPWEELADVRHVIEEGERIEFRSKFSTEPFVLVVDHFSEEQADEIKRSLLAKAA